MATWENTKRDPTLTISLTHRIKSIEQERTIISNTLMKTLLKCTLRCHINLKLMIRCSMMMSPQRCSLSRMATNNRCFRPPKMRSRASVQAWMATSKLNNSISSVVLLPVPSNNTTTWAIWCLSRVAETTPFTWPVTETCSLMDQACSALSVMVDLAVNSHQLSLSHWGTRESFRLHAVSITLLCSLTKLMYMHGEEASRDSLASARVSRFPVLRNTLRVSMESLSITSLAALSSAWQSPKRVTFGVGEKLVSGSSAPRTRDSSSSLKKSKWSQNKERTLCSVLPDSVMLPPSLTRVSYSRGVSMYMVNLVKATMRPDTHLRWFNMLPQGTNSILSLRLNAANMQPTWLIPMAVLTHGARVTLEWETKSPKLICLRWLRLTLKTAFSLTYLPMKTQSYSMRLFAYMKSNLDAALHPVELLSRSLALVSLTQKN